MRIQETLNAKTFNPSMIPVLEKQIFSMDTPECQLMEIDKDKMEAKFIAVPTQVTIDGRAVYVPGVDLKEFDARNTILFGHYQDLLIGRSMWSKKESNKNGDKEVIVKVEFKPDDMGRYVYEGVRDGWFKFVSPGLMPVVSFYGDEANIAYKEDYGKNPKTELWYYGRETLMYELSVVNVPAWSGATQKMNLNNMPEKMKKTLAFEQLSAYITKVEELEQKLNALAGTLGSHKPESGDGEKPLGDGGNSSWDVSEIDVSYALSIFNKRLKGDS